MQHLVQLRRVAEDGRVSVSITDRTRSSTGSSRGSADGRPRSPRHPNRTAFRILLAAERQNLAHEISRAARGAQHFGDDPVRTAAPRQVVLRHLRVADDRGEDVVEVVRDAAASVPIASIFCAWKSSASSVRRVVSAAGALTISHEHAGDLLPA
jgi:hypothetical protein